LVPMLCRGEYPRQVSGAWVFKDTRMPVSIVFENLEAGATIDEIAEWVQLTREQIVTVLEFAAASADPALSSPSQPAAPLNGSSCLTTAHPRRFATP
jgi:uncharacterized protein (DUF433 family)